MLKSMKRINSILFLLGILIFTGCSDRMPDEDLITHEFQNKGEEDTMDGIDIYDFYFLNKAPDAKEVHSIVDVIKVYFTDLDNKKVAIDVKEEQIYKNPRWSNLGVDSKEEPVDLEGTGEVLKLLEDFEVQKWKKDYTKAVPSSYQDGYSWRLWIQFEDGTVEKHTGSGPEKEGIIPNYLEEFARELNGLVEKKLTESKKHD